MTTPTLQHTPEGSPYLPLTTGSTTQIYLTPFYPTDAQALYETHNRPEVSSVLIMPPNPYLISHAEYWINLMLTIPTPASNPLPLQAIRSGSPSSDGRFIGSVALGPQEELNKEGKKEWEIGYYLHPEWRGKGIMGAAVRALAGWGKGEIGEAGEVVVRVEEGNVGSRKVIESMGEWKRVSERDEWHDWPERHGGGRRWILFWRWEE